MNMKNYVYFKKICRGEETNNGRNLDKKEGSHNGKNWATVKNGDSYHIPVQNSGKIAEKVTAGGVTTKVYIWMEGTDADCRNSIVNDDKSSYNVVVNLAGVTAE